jgi:CHAT domain-containing protein
MHIGTHGVLDTRSPWFSYISLKEKMRVIDLAQVKNRAVLIVFAACRADSGRQRSATTSWTSRTRCWRLVRQLTWMVDDVATMILMVLFYRNMRERRSEGLVVAELWGKAIVEFCDLDTESAKQILSKWAKN